ncbi:MAG: hypothetical protein IJE91_03075 [Clostridia bacterium]|nr:hypothetical protein [Clostridia bacterium]
MEYIVKNNEIFIPASPDFNAKQTLECGQVFRFKQTAFGYEVYSLNHKATLICQKDGTKIVCDDVKYFINYFDLLTDYAKIKQELNGNAFVKNAISFGEGIRILRQDPIETIISFLISQNNNIPRIKKIIETICECYGEKCDGYFAFPTLQKLSTIPKQFFTDIKCGYRDEYLFSSIQKLASGFNIQAIKTMPSEQANKYLTELKGVGNKVADCILLYGFYKTDVFPTDTWIKKVYSDFNPSAKNKQAVQIRNEFVKTYGNLSGYAQQYLFYSKREKNN